MAAVLGIDGCRGGWVVVRREGSAVSVAVYPTLKALAAGQRRVTRAFIDMPIGLPAREPRLCDRLARQRLGPRRGSVFPVPCRAAVAAGDYTAACRENRRELGRALSRQSWNLCAKIGEVDRFLRHARQPALHESHPELCFAALAGEPIAEPKRTRAGFRRRRALLGGHFPEGAHLIEPVLALHPRRLLAPDDLLDAMVLAYAAGLDDAELMRLPSCPPRDEAGLPMSIICPRGI